MNKFDVALNALNALIEEVVIANDERYKSKEKYPDIMRKWRNEQNWIDAQDNAIRTALTQAAEIERGEQWKPIASAPKDEAILGCALGLRYKEVMSQIQVISCSFDPNEPSYAVFEWNGYEWEPCGYDCAGLYEQPSIEFSPTHWKPIIPPASEGK